MRRADSAMDITDKRSRQSTSGRSNHINTLDIKCLGVCAGSSLNELNYALVQYHQDAPNAPLRMQILKHSIVPIPAALRLTILNTLRDAQSQPSAMAHFNLQLGHLFSEGIKTFCESSHVALGSIDLVGTHSSTMPARRRSSDVDGSAMHPFGWNAIIKAETGISAVFEFGVMESPESSLLASPVAFVDRLLLRHPSKFRACLNIDELASFNFIPPLTDSDSNGIISRYCGPGSLLIDYAMAYCTSNEQSEDNNGSYATQGAVNQEIVNRFLGSRDYMRALPPLSIAREMFGDHDGQRLLDECVFMNMSEVDTIATITRITAQNIFAQYRRLLGHYFPSGRQVDELFISGAGAQNLSIIEFLENMLPETVITKPLDDIGVPGEANAPVCYAHLALEVTLAQATRSVGLSSSPSASAMADDACIRGTILRGDNWEDLSARILRFSAGQQLHLTKDVRCTGNLESAIQGLGLR
ncbi:hypothetical protein NX059_003206 [Plenodomus lindquistii]|nr:hypothetical protein NX059_003206 [Plenodomus lindquistii]